MRIIPAIDIMEGECVRLTQGDYNASTIYYKNPVDAAKNFEDYGIKYVHIVDLDGARSQKIINHEVLHQIATQTNLDIDFGGGLKSIEDLNIAFECGASQVTIGSIAALQPDLFMKWLVHFGPDKIILGADYKDQRIAVNGWKEYVDLHVIDFITDYVNKGVMYVISTNVAKDGMMNGPDIPLYKDILGKINTNLIASGGISTVEQLINLKTIGCEAAIIGKAIYENKISLTQISQLC